MKVRNLHPLLMVAAIAMATAGCEANESFAGNDDDYSQSDASDGAYSDGAYADGTASQYRAGSDQANVPSPSGGMQTVTITDQSGGGQPMRAGSITVPANWQAQGGIDWDRSVPCLGNQMRYQWQATSPDGSQAFTVMPGMSWQVQGTQMQMNPCPAMPLRSAQDFLSAFVQQKRPGARIIQYRPSATQGSNQNNNGQGSSRIDAGDMLIGYQNNGQDIREVLSTYVTFTEFQGNVVGGARTVTSLRAPDGQLDFGLAEAINTSMKADRQWLAETGNISRQSADAFAGQQSDQITTWHNGRMADINARGAADRAAIRSSTARDIANINSQIVANTSATDDNIQRRTLEGIGGYNTYNDPTGGNTVQADINYGRVIREDNGSYTGTNDPYYNPAGSDELERVQ